MASAFLKTANTAFADHDITNGQINTLKECLDGTITSADAAKRLTSHPEASSTPVELQQRLSGLWTLLNETAVNDKSAQPNIISILQAIRQLPKAEIPTGDGAEVMDFDDGYYWRELTGWANDWADAFNAHAAGHLIEHPDDDERKAAWTNACAYTARLAVTGDEALSSYGAGLERATSAISDVLEVHADGEPEDLDAAAQLFVYASPELYRRCKAGQAGGMLTSKSSMWTGGEGFSEARWKLWLERWAAFAGADRFSEHARQVASQAYASANSIA